MHQFQGLPSRACDRQPPRFYAAGASRDRRSKPVGPTLSRLATPRLSGPAATVGNILLVDDHSLVLQVLARALDVAGFESVCVTDSSTARALLGEMFFDAVVLEVAISGSMDGIELAKWIRLSQPTMPIVFMTGGFTPERVALVPQDSRSRLLLKPFGAADLAGLVIGLLAS